MTFVAREAPPGSRRHRVVSEPATGPRRWTENDNVRWDATRPGAAPQFRCAVCARWLTRSHYLLNDPGVVLCGACLTYPGVHAEWYPDCPGQWHGATDHAITLGTRAAIAMLLGLWPVKGLPVTRSHA